MKARVIYESTFGNTRAVAEAIAEGLSAAFEIETVEVGHASPDTSDVDLVVIGGPTHAWAMSRPTTRKSAQEQAAKGGIAPASDGIGVREWLASAGDGNGRMAAAFDTGVGKIGFISAGSAAKGEASRLGQHGYRLIADPEQFLVDGTAGATMLRPGELERATAWGADLARLATAAHA